MLTIDKGTKKAFYGDRISDNMTVTPEGFLIKSCYSKTVTRQFCGLVHYIE